MKMRKNPKPLAQVLPDLQLVEAAVWLDKMELDEWAEYKWAYWRRGPYCMEHSQESLGGMSPAVLDISLSCWGTAS